MVIAKKANRAEYTVKVPRTLGTLFFCKKSITGSNTMEMINPNNTHTRMSLMRNKRYTTKAANESLRIVPQEISNRRSVWLFEGSTIVTRLTIS